MKPMIVCLLWMVALSACGGESAATNPPPACTGASCMCAQGNMCDFSTDVCGASCSLSCADQTVCQGACGESCSIDCGEGAVCRVTLGKSGSISCKRGSSCDVVCEGSCSVTCTDATQCRLKCKGESTAKDLVNGGVCDQVAP